MGRYKIGILGATGAVGREMLAVLAERGVPGEDLRLLAGPRSAGRQLPYRDEMRTVETAGDFSGLDFVLGAVDSGLSRQYAPAIRAAGAVYIDNSSAFRLDPAVPLVVPEVNGADALEHRGVIANPNCSTVIAMTALGALHRLRPVRALHAVTYQAVSGAGAAGLAELERQLQGDLSAQVFPQPILGNVIPDIGMPGADGCTDEERKMEREGRRILHAPDLLVDCTCVRVPVRRCHAIALTVWTEGSISTEQARAALEGAPGVRFIPDSQVGPTPQMAAGGDAVLAGRLRQSPLGESGLSLFVCGDQLRKGAASNAVQILDLLTE